MIWFIRRETWNTIAFYEKGSKVDYKNNIVFVDYWPPPWLSRFIHRATRITTRQDNAGYDLYKVGSMDLVEWGGHGIQVCVYVNILYSHTYWYESLPQGKWPLVWNSKAKESSNWDRRLYSLSIFADSFFLPCRKKCLNGNLAYGLSLGSGSSTTTCTLGSGAFWKLQCRDQDHKFVLSWLLDCRLPDVCLEGIK